MLLRSVTHVTLVAFIVMATAAPMRAQPSLATSDPVVERMRQLVARGSIGDARRLVDSVLATAAGTLAQLGEALYWRAMLRSTADSTHQDLLRLIVEVPLSLRMEDALAHVAEDELRAGDRVSARRHLDRLVREHLVTDRGAKAAHQLARMMLDEGAVAAACVVLDSARSHMSPENVELGNQIAYTARQCAQSRETTGATADLAVSKHSDSAPPRTLVSATAKGQSQGKITAVGVRRWSVQVAAFSVRGDAMQLAERLAARGYETRVTTEKPYRVRIGRFGSRNEAGKVVVRLKAEKTDAIIVEAERR